MSKRLFGNKKDLDGFSVTRLLPNQDKTMIGPFIFLDHMGPADFEAGNGIDVRPHPHIGMAALTYLFEGALLHQDSLDNHCEIFPGDVNFMTAGRGIVHSEREAHETKANAHRMNGLQCWLALPRDLAEMEPAFEQVKKMDLPVMSFEGVFARIVLGEAYGESSPISGYSLGFLVDVISKLGNDVKNPNPEQECAVYIIEGEVKIGDTAYRCGDFVLLEADETIHTCSYVRLVLLGGAVWPEQPHLFWNFVSFDVDRIEQAKQDWREQNFAKIPGDDLEFTPLPE